jgi:hypothetical protein
MYAQCAPQSSQCTIDRPIHSHDRRRSAEMSGSDCKENRFDEQNIRKPLGFGTRKHFQKQKKFFKKLKREVNVAVLGCLRKICSGGYLGNFSFKEKENFESNLFKSTSRQCSFEQV